MIGGSKKMIMIIYCHPYEQSYNHAELEVIKENLSAAHQNYEVIDLYADHFNPVYSKEELWLYHQGQTTDPLVTKYLKLCQHVNTVIFITPFWWNDIPGMLKGFIDKVMKEGMGLSHTITKIGVKGELTNVKHCYVLTTSTSPTLHQLGFRHCYWQNFDGIINSSLEQREKYLTKLHFQHFR